MRWLLLLCFVFALGRSNAEDAPAVSVDAAIGDLSSNDFTVREKAKATLLKAGQPAIPKLIALLNSPDAEVANAGQAILAKHGAAALPALCAEKQKHPSAEFDAYIERFLTQHAEKLLADPLLTVKLDPTAALDLKTELFMMWGSGHGGTLSLCRLVPNGDGCSVLLIKYDEGWHPYKSTWPPDRAPVTATMTTLDKNLHRAFLNLAGKIYGATLTPLHSNSISGSSADFCAVASADLDGKNLFREAYVGYYSSRREPFAKAQAFTAIAQEIIRGSEAKEYTLTDSDRAWVSGIVNTWHYPDTFDWWVRERMVALSGVAADKSVLPRLRKLLETDPKTWEHSVAREVYQAINAVARLTGKDVRTKPVEEMDLSANAKKTLELLDELEPKKKD